MALDLTRKLTLEDVKNNFKEYNFIISLNGVMIDTTNYVQAHHAKTEIVGAYPSGKKGWLVLANNDTDNLSNASGEDGIKDIGKGEARIIIFEECVEEIKVKSKRNFLFNQKTKA